MGAPRNRPLHIALTLLLFAFTPVPASGEDKPPVVLFTIDFCPECLGAKKWFRDHDVEFREFNIEQSERARELFERVNGRGIPLILVGDQRLQGFDPDAFRTLREKAVSSP